MDKMKFARCISDYINKESRITFIVQEIKQHLNIVNNQCMTEKI